MAACDCGAREVKGQTLHRRECATRKALPPKASPLPVGPDNAIDYPARVPRPLHEADSDTCAYCGEPLPYKPRFCSSAHRVAAWRGQHQHE